MNTREIIDVHTHIWPDKIAVRAADNIVNYYGLARQGDGSIDGLFNGANELPNARFVISSATLRPDTAHARVGNDYLLETAKNDSRFIPLSSFHPFMGVDEAVAELERTKKLGSKGIKLHPDFQQFFVDDEVALEIYKEAARLKMPILFHVGDPNTDFSTPRRMLNILEKVPELTIIAAHMCGYGVWEDAKECLIGTPVYTDTSEARLGLDAKQLYELIELHGIDKVMFGSDYPLWNTNFSFFELLESEFSEDEKDKILSQNAKKVFDIE